MAQTGDNVFVMEALKGSFKIVRNNTIRNAIQRWPFGGYKIMRVNSTKYPWYYSPATAQTILNWGNNQIDKPFDEEMLKPVKRRFSTGKRFVKLDPDCKERRRVLDYYYNGGPSKWICAQLVAWTLAFAGGIDKDYGIPTDDCDVSEWLITNLEPNPGQLMRFPIWDESNFFSVRCPPDKCWVAAPDTPRWAGGTTAMTSTSTTTLETSTRTSTTTLETSTSTTTLETSTLETSTRTTTLEAALETDASTATLKTSTSAAATTPKGDPCGKDFQKSISKVMEEASDTPSTGVDMTSVQSLAATTD